MATANDCLLVHTSARNTESIRHALLIGIGKRLIKGFIEKRLVDTDWEWKKCNAKVCYFEPAGSLQAEDKNNLLKMRHQPAILRHIGRLAGLYPKSDPDKALIIDEVMDLCQNLRMKFGGILEPKECDKMLVETMQFIEALIEENVKATGHKYVVGSSLTVADLELASLVGWLGQPKFTERGTFDREAFAQEFINVRAIRKFVNGHPYLVDADTRYQVHSSLCKTGAAVAGEAHTEAYIASAAKMGSPGKGGKR